jgi:hypothetical protein
MAVDFFEKLRAQIVAEQEADALLAAQNQAAVEEAARAARLKDLSARFKNSHTKSVEVEFKLLQRRNSFSISADIIDMREFAVRRDIFRRTELPATEGRDGRRRFFQEPS